VGSVPADYAPLHPADDLARCLRYYEVVGPNSSYGISASNYASAGGQALYVPIRFAARKPITPTLTKTGTWTVANCAQPTVSSGDVDCFQLSATSSGAGPFYCFNGGTGTCSVVVEANP
jgi:hypothetical protein